MVKRRGALDYVFQFPDIAGPRVCAEAEKCLVGDTWRHLTGGRVFPEKVCDQKGNVVAPISERGQVKIYDI